MASIITKKIAQRAKNNWVQQKVKGLLWMVLAMPIAGCVEEYVLPPTATKLNLLVVDGNINLDQKTAVVVLTRTQDLAMADHQPVQESGAQVSIEEENGARYQLHESPGQKGRYAGFNSQWAYGRKYRLRIKTKEGKEYGSELVTTHKTPIIDSVTWRVEGDKVQVEVNTHDPENETRYYRWQIEETYEYQSYFPSAYMRDEEGRPVLRPPHLQIYTCWKTDRSSAILVTSTSQLSQDVVNHFLLARHEGNGDRFSRRYSIGVTQYAISQEEYTYWQMLKKNTESVGSLFDAQPAYVTGNISCLTAPEEPVFGFFSAQSTTSKRLFIEAEQLKKWGFKEIPMACYIIELADFSQLPLYNNTEIIDIGSKITLGTKDCTDCRLKGGSNQRPSFW
ncbi:MAG: DUF4249 domain-containing protein [Rufibacter sp.]